MTGIHRWWPRREVAGKTLRIALVCFALGCADADSAPVETLVEPWSADLDLRIGSVDDPATALTAVGPILTHADGRFYVSQPQDGVIRMHAADGALLGTFGGQGEGPGEFGGIGSMGWLGGGNDTIWVDDFQLRRVSYFSSDGTFARSVQITSPPYREFMRPGVQALLPDGTALGLPSFPSRMLATGEITSIPVLRFSIDGGETTPVVETDPRNRQLAIACGSGMSYSGQPYADAPLTAFSGETGRIAVVDRRAATQPADARFGVSMVNAAGDTVWTRDYLYEPVPLPAAERDSVLDGRLERGREFATRVGSGCDTDSEVRSKLYLPAFRPPVSSAQISSDGSVLLLLATDPGAGANRWLVLDAEGEPRAKIELAGNTRLVDVVGTTAWAVETDALGVQYVLRLRLGPIEP
jgi:hypothetical protein